MRVGVFDSGAGGLSVANAIQTALPDLEIILREDKEHIPYGTKSPDEIFSYIVPIFQSMIDENCQVIVVACNTVTTTLIDRLRKKFTTPLVAIEPMVKPAAEQTKTGVIAICATPATLASARYRWLKQTYAQKVKVLEPDCSDWALMIERKQYEEQKIKSRIAEVLDQGADVIVLGCTHYHWIEKEIKALAKDRAKVLQPEAAIIRQLKRVLGQLN
jgi:glutamate racemase